MPWAIPDYHFWMPRGLSATTSHTSRRAPPVFPRSAVSSLPLACLLGLSTCSAPPAFIRDDIQSENPADRILAIRAAAEARDDRSVPLLVDRLEDEDRAVRFFAIIALDKITGHRFGYDYAKPDAGRRKAVERWRAYVRRGGTDVAAGEDESGQTTSGLSAGSPEARRIPVPSR